MTDWLSATALSLAIREYAWCVPAIQSVHILALSLALFCTVMVDLRLLGVIRPASVTATEGRGFLPWVWGALVIAAISGAALVIGEPDRTLPNPLFQLKMAMLAAVLGLMTLRRRLIASELTLQPLSSGRRHALHATAILSLALWVAITCAGRWIAYVDA